ncbi:hypothetical protein [Niallia sp. 03133]|uniref:hypothetical protein n=1 Tax=Niallia sp. 03133 TaxID=3458060 RepID=UPI004045003B
MKIFDENGITLYELLATITILAIVMPVIYGVFQSGLSLYNKIQIEGQLRDDADYAVSMMMNAFNSFPFDYVESTSENRIDLFDSEQTALEQNDKETSSFYTPNKKNYANAEDITGRSIEFVDQTVDDKAIKSVAINGQTLEGNGNFDGSSLSLTCTKSDKNDAKKCLHGTIYVTFKLDQERLKRPLTLESQFGF